MHAKQSLARALLTGLLIYPLASYLIAAEAPSRLEPKALDILKTMSTTLTAAKSLQFEAIVSYESPSRLGPPLAYLTRAEVSLQRPNHLQVTTLGDGPRNELYYDGRRLQGYAPAENLLASMPAPADLDAALKLAFDQAAIYLPFTDLIVNDPYKDLRADMRLAFYIGQSSVVGDTTTDIIAYATDNVFIQAWIGVDDHLPRMLRATFRDDPAQLRHELVLRNWKLNPTLSANTFLPHFTRKPVPISFASPKLPRARHVVPQAQPITAKP